MGGSGGNTFGYAGVVNTGSRTPSSAAPHPLALGRGVATASEVAPWTLISLALSTRLYEIFPVHVFIDRILCAVMFGIDHPIFDATS